MEQEYIITSNQLYIRKSSLRYKRLLGVQWVSYMSYIAEDLGFRILDVPLQ